MQILRKIAALPFLMTGNILVLLAVIMIAVGGKTEGVDRLRGLYLEISRIVKDDEVIS